jgi:uncharacterized OsmC-like protein
MKITLVSEEEILLEDTGGTLTIEAPGYDWSYSPYHMLASSLASCTFSVLVSWAGHAKLPVEGLKLGVSWTFAEQPHRVGSLTLRIEWPSLPPERVKAAERAAALCPVHHTLSGGTSVTIEASR